MPKDYLSRRYLVFHLQTSIVCIDKMRHIEARSTEHANRLPSLEADPHDFLSCLV
jgi:hypothetical protein